MAKKFKRSLVWMRRDLRLADNTALFEAGKNSDEVVVAFVFDTNILDKLENKSDTRVSFIFESLSEVNEALEKKDSQVVVRHGSPLEEIPKLAKELGVQAVFYNEDYENYAKKRDQKVAISLSEIDVEAHGFKDHVIFSGGEVMKPDGNPYQMFTPYKRTWLSKVKPKDCEIKKPKCQFVSTNTLKKHSEKMDIAELGFKTVEQHYPFHKPGRAAGVKMLKQFTNAIKNYDKDRDFPFIEGGTSGLSVHLRFGTLSIRECVSICSNSKSKGVETWLSELIWRDFYSMILDQYPHVEKEAFKKQYNKIKWPKSEKNFKAWCEGKTGFPIVDAGMRQLNETGWMHNRVRMIVASFLVKDLLVDWRKGEAYFAEKLLDFDLASNNGGWQWSASTGCDAQPYFRIFNPSLQSKRFDKDAEYIKEWVPELVNKTAKEIHDPENVDLSFNSEYPQPIVVHAEQKKKAVSLFKEI